MAMSAPENAPRPGLPALKFGIIIPVGPSANDVERAGDVLASVLAYEPETPLVLFIDDGGKDRRLDEKFRATATCRLVNIFNTRNGHGIGETSGLSAGMLLAIAWLHANADCGFVMKLDTDALIIAPFAEKILRTLAARPDVGMVGLYNRMCDGSVRDQTSFRKMLGKLASPFAVWRNPPGWGYLTVHLWGRGATIRRQITEAIRAGYRPAEFILGGAYAFTGEAVRRFAKHGFLDDPHLWLGTHFSEDVVLSMRVRDRPAAARDDCRRRAFCRAALRPAGYAGAPRRARLQRDPQREKRRAFQRGGDPGILSQAARGSGGKVKSAPASAVTCQ